MLGISVYPYKENIEETLKYIDKSASLGYGRIFLNLLLFDYNQIDKFVSDNKKIINFAKSKGFEIYVDVNPKIFELLGIKHTDLSFFKELGVDGIRLDGVFDGDVESELTYNEYGLKIELNASQDTKYIDNIFCKKPVKSNLIACHNFYPQRYTGLSESFYIKTSKIFKDAGLRLAAFVTSQVAEHGPHVVDDKLPTLELHRDLDIEIQTKHLIALGNIDDIIVSNAYASTDELERVAKVYKPYITFKLENVCDNLSVEEKHILSLRHMNRGDLNDYLIRSTIGRIEYRDKSITPRKNDTVLEKGTVYIANDNFGQYKGELVIVKKDVEISLENINIVGKIKKEELFLIDYIDAYTRFKIEL